MIAVSQVSPGRYPLTREGIPVLPDLVPEIVGARIVLAGDGHLLYDLERQWSETRIVVPGADMAHAEPFLMPPVFALLMAPLTALPYGWAAAAWLALTLVLLAGAFRLLWPLLGDWGVTHRSRIVLGLVASWPLVALLVGGQNSALWLFLLVAGLWLLAANRDTQAGVVLGLGMLKPQLFLALPFYLLCTRRWRALAAWVVVAVTLFVASWATVGLQGLRAYAALLSSDAYAERIIRFGWKMASGPALLRATMPEAAAVGTFLLALGAAYAIVRTAPHAPLAVGYSVAILAGALANPHFYAYDALVLAVPVLLFLARWRHDPVLRLTVGAMFGLSWFALLFRAELAQPGSRGLLAAPWVALPLLALLMLAIHQSVRQHIVPRFE